MKMNITMQANNKTEEKVLRELLKQARDPKTALGKLVKQGKAKITKVG